MKYPNQKQFIFSVFDDTDVSTLDSIKPVYDYLSSLGLFITKSVWPKHCDDKHSNYAGSHSLEDPSYANYIKELSQRGFEISFHGATMESSKREVTIESFNIFHEKLGFYPKSYSCHAGNTENLYWGQKRFCSLFTKKLYKLISQDSKEYMGDVEGSPYYWGDLFKKHVQYMRTFTYDTVNLLHVSDQLPYKNANYPEVKGCFFTSDADNVEEFNNLISEKNQEELEREKGVCIISTHLGKGFVKEGSLNSVTKDLLYKLSRRNGWFAPVSDVLGFLEYQGNHRAVISRSALLMLEIKWFIHAFKRKMKRKKYEKSELQYLFPSS